MALFKKYGNTTNEGGYVSKTNDNIRNIGPQAYICVYGRKPKMDIAAQKLIKTVGVINKLSVLQSVFTGGYSSISSVVQTAVENSLSVDSASLAQCAYNVQQRNLAQDGLNIYVRVNYEEYTNGWLSDGWEEKHTEWKQYTEGGIGGGMGFGGMDGNYESVEDAKKDIPKAMKWTLKQFSEENK